ncbi:MAG: hypothetical protein ABWZ57_11500 [Mesorhizobium sp.]
MSEVRPLEDDDIPAVATMFQRIFRHSGRASPSLEAYLRSLFLDRRRPHPEIRSRVHVAESGAISGFIGAFGLSLSFEGRPLKAAVCGSLMVEGHRDDPFAGARLLRAFLAGQQDISITETANDVATAMWRKANGMLLPDYSLEWLRILRPAAFALELAGESVPPVRWLKPAAWPVDALLGRIGARHVGSYLSGAVPSRVLLSSEPADDTETVELLQRLTSPFAVRPEWTAGQLDRMVAEARDKPLYGTMVRRVVRRPGGRRAGLFLYHGDAGRIGRVLQVLAEPGQIGAVVDSMLACAQEQGLVALRGRCQPALLPELIERRFLFSHAAATIVHAREAALIEPFRAGRAFFNGFAGESWTRLIGGRFA